MSNVHIFEDYLYRILFSDANSVCKERYESLTRIERARLLRDNPALASRTFMLKQTILLDYMIKSELFGEIDAFWIRTEFQRSLNAHLHMLLSIRGAKTVSSIIDAEKVCLQICLSYSNFIG